MDPNLQQSWKYPESINCDYFPPGWDLQRLRQATTRELWDLDLEVRLRASNFSDATFV